VTVVEIDTPRGVARAHLQSAAKPSAALVLGHGAGGGIAAPDLVAASDAARALGLSVALVEQPYRVAGRRSSPPAHHLDAAWEAVVNGLRANALGGLALVTGGRSAGARVACRTWEATRAAAVLCLAYPLQPPQRSGKEPAPSRRSELDAVKVPVLVVQGDRDRFGMPPPGPHRKVAEVPGDHALKADLEAVSGAVSEWLSTVV
jgi:predicted alpha/beta-hydrolase family hydrolase